MRLINRLLKVVLVNIAILIFLAGFVALGLPIAYDVYQSIHPSIPGDYSVMPNFKNRALTKKHFEEYSLLKYRYYDYVGWRNLSFKGETLNTDTDGYRRHSHTEFKDASIWVFGGSTILGYGSSDKETIPAYLEHFSGESTFNFGESGWVAHQSLNLLQKVYLQGGRPKYVFFYDGVNDVDHKCSAAGNFYSSSLERKFRQYVEDGRESESGLLMLGVFKPFLQAYQKFYEKFHGGLQYGQQAQPNLEVTTVGDDCTRADSVKLDLVAKSLVSDWAIARKLVESHGGVFIPILQPVALLGNPNISNQPGVRDKPTLTRYELVYGRVKNILNEKQFKYYDFTHVLDAGGIDDLYFFDVCHLSPNGNEKVAIRLYELVKSKRHDASGKH